jgi:hypothetical protein
MTLSGSLLRCADASLKSVTGETPTAFRVENTAHRSTTSEQAEAGNMRLLDVTHTERKAPCLN